MVLPSFLNPAFLSSLIRHPSALLKVTAQFLRLRNVSLAFPLPVGQQSGQGEHLLLGWPQTLLPTSSEAGSRQAKGHATPAICPKRTSDAQQKE